MSPTTTRSRTWRPRLTGLIDAEGDLRALSVLRILLGPIVLLHFAETFRDAADDIVYSDRYWLPYFSWYPEAGAGLYEAMLWLCLGTAVAMSLGVMTRVATAYTAFFVGYHLFLSKTHFAHCITS